MIVTALIVTFGCPQKLMMDRLNNKFESCSDWQFCLTEYYAIFTAKSLRNSYLYVTLSGFQHYELFYVDIIGFAFDWILSETVEKVQKWQF